MDVDLMLPVEIRGKKVAAYETHWIADMEFVFAIVQWPRVGYRIYVLRRPGFGIRWICWDATHRLFDFVFGKEYICVRKSAYPKNLTAARELALMWAQAIARYIKTGQKF